MNEQAYILKCKCKMHIKVAHNWLNEKRFASFVKQILNEIL